MIMTLTIEEALRRASFCFKEAGLDNRRSEAELLMMHVLNCSRLDLVLSGQAILPEEKQEEFQGLVRRRRLGEPVAYLVRSKYFYGRPFRVNRSVLIPRPETELIIDASVEWAKGNQFVEGAGITALDLGTGSGCLAITLAAELPQASVYGVDVSRRALAVAAENAALLVSDNQPNWLEGTFSEALKSLEPAVRFNLVVANPPYLTKADMDQLSDSVKKYEPCLALYGGEDGLDAYRCILQELPLHLESPGAVLFEIGAGQAEAVRKLIVETAAFKSVTFKEDLGGWPRVAEALF